MPALTVLRQGRQHVHHGVAVLAAGHARHRALAADHPVVRDRLSSQVHGQSDAVEWLRDFHDRPLRPPQSNGAEPRGEFVEWHTREVFREPAWCPRPAVARGCADC